MGNAEMTSMWGGVTSGLLHDHLMSLKRGRLNMPI